MQSPQNENVLKNVTNTLYWLKTVNQQDLVISGIKLAEKKKRKKKKYFSCEVDIWNIIIKPNKPFIGCRSL